MHNQEGLATKPKLSPLPHVANLCLYVTFQCAKCLFIQLCRLIFMTSRARHAIFPLAGVTQLVSGRPGFEHRLPDISSLFTVPTATFQQMPSPKVPRTSLVFYPLHLMAIQVT